MEKRKLLSELKYAYESSNGLGMVQNQSLIMDAMKFIDDNYDDYLDDCDIKKISKKYQNSVSVTEAIKRASIVSINKKDLIKGIRDMYEMQVNPHKKEIKDEIFDSIDWINSNMPDLLTDKELDIISSRYKYSGEILDAIDTLS